MLGTAGFLLLPPPSSSSPSSPRPLLQALDLWHETACENNFCHRAPTLEACSNRGKCAEKENEKQCQAVPTVFLTLFSSTATVFFLLFACFIFSTVHVWIRSGCFQVSFMYRAFEVFGRFCSRWRFLWMFITFHKQVGVIILSPLTFARIPLTTFLMLSKFLWYSLHI